MLTVQGKSKRPHVETEAWDVGNPVFFEFDVLRDAFDQLFLVEFLPGFQMVSFQIKKSNGVGVGFVRVIGFDREVYWHAESFKGTGESGHVFVNSEEEHFVFLVSVGLVTLEARDPEV